MPKINKFQTYQWGSVLEVSNGPDVFVSPGSGNISVGLSALDASLIISRTDFRSIEVRPSESSTGHDVIFHWGSGLHYTVGSTEDVDQARNWAAQTTAMIESIRLASV